VTAPLSGQFDQEANQTTGMFSAPRTNIAPRGVVNLPQDGPVYAGSAGIYWDQMPAFIGGQSGYQALSTETGVPMGTPAVEDELKVGGGPSQAQVPAYGGTAAY
jgi:hypothetical protein